MTREERVDSGRCPAHLVDMIAKMFPDPAPHPVLSPEEVNIAMRANVQALCDLIWTEAWNAGAVFMLERQPARMIMIDPDLIDRDSLSERLVSTRGALPATTCASCGGPIYVGLARIIGKDGKSRHTLCEEVKDAS